MGRFRELTAALEAALVRELRGAWHQLNDAYFRGALAVPTIELGAGCATLGRWVADTRTLEISRALVIEQPWGAVVEVIKHEMAHQYVHEVLGEEAQTPHGKAFRQACARLGIDARATGVPRFEGDSTDDKLVERIARLLALAQSSNRHEAEAAAAVAQRLMLRHNIAAAAAPGTRDYAFVQLGRPTGRLAEKDRLVAMILGKHFFVEPIWVPSYRPLEGKRGSVLEVCGTRSNVAMAEYVHGFLHESAERLWNGHRIDRGVRSNRDRLSFQAGVMTGFADKLARQQVESSAQGLVWVRDGDLASYFRRRHPRVRHIRHAGTPRTEAWAQGREAGRAIVLHRPVAAGVTSGGKLLR